MNGPDLLELAHKLNMRRARVGASNLVASCPFAPFTHLKEDGSYGQDKDASFGIKIEPNGQSVFNCFACGETGDLMQLCHELGNLRRVDYTAVEEWVFEVEEVQTIATACNLFEGMEDLDERPRGRKRRQRMELRKQDVYGEHELAIFEHPAPPYAKERGLTDEAIKSWDLRHDPEKKRLVMPVRSMDGKLVGIKGRSYVDDPDKYLNYLGSIGGRYFFGEWMLPPLEDLEYIVLVEGEFDVMHIWMAGYPVLGIMGGKLTNAMVKKLRAWGIDLVIYADPGSTGDKWARRVISDLGDELSIRRVMLGKDSRDPAEHTIEENTNLIEDAELVL